MSADSGGSLDAVPANLSLKKERYKKSWTETGAGYTMEPDDPGAHSSYHASNPGRAAQSSDASNQY